MMTNIKKAVKKIQKAKETNASPAKTKKVKVEATSQTSEKNSRTPHKLSEKERTQMIAINAYFRAQRRNFTLGCEQEDWLAAETEVDATL
jgi:Zn-dependent peptidase ImmA (M78 family)